MQGYANIGTLYLLPDQNSTKILLWAVIENNLNDKTSTLSVVEDCPEKGMKAKIDAKWLYERESIGPILPPAGEIVIEEGREFIKPTTSKAQSKVLKS